MLRPCFRKSDSPPGPTGRSTLCFVADRSSGTVLLSEHASIGWPVALDENAMVEVLPERAKDLSSTRLPTSEHGVQEEPKHQRCSQRAVITRCLESDPAPDDRVFVDTLRPRSMQCYSGHCGLAKGASVTTSQIERLGKPRGPMYVRRADG